MIFENYLPYYRRNLQIAVPVMLSQAGQVLVQQVDNMMVGSVGTTELAAASFANSVFILGMILGMGFTFGLTPIVGHAFATGDNHRSGTLFRNAIVVNMTTGILLTIIMFFISFIMDRMGQSENVVALAIPYYRIQVISLLPFLLYYTFKQYSEGLGNTKVAMYITITANIINIIFNYILIFGKLGAPELGLNGAGYATLLARTIMPILFIVAFYKSATLKRHLIFLKIALLDTKIMRQLFQVGWPIALQMLLEVSAFAMSGIMIGWIGEIPLAAHQIALGLASVTFMIITGIGSATTIRIAHQYSKKEFTSVKKATYASLHLVLIFMTFTAISFLLFRHQIPKLYNQNPEVIALAAQLLIMAAIFQIFDGVQVVMLSALRGLADVKTAMFYAFISYIVINIPISYFLAFIIGWGAIGVWIGFILGLGVAATLFYLRFNKQCKSFITK